MQKSMIIKIKSKEIWKNENEILKRKKMD